MDRLNPGRSLGYIPFSLQMIRDYKAKFMDCPNPELMDGEAVDISLPMGFCVPFYALANMLLTEASVCASVVLPLLCWCFMSMDPRAGRGGELFGVEEEWDVEETVRRVFQRMDRDMDAEVLLESTRRSHGQDNYIAMHLDPPDCEVLEMVRGFIWCKCKSLLELERNMLVLREDCVQSGEAREFFTYVMGYLQSPYGNEDVEQSSRMLSGLLLQCDST